VVQPRCPKCGSDKLRVVGENHYLCKYCGHEFYACPICGEAFAHQRQLAGHVGVHRKLEGRWVLEELKALRELLEEVIAGQRLVLAKLDQVSEKLDRALEPTSTRAAPPTANESLPDFLQGNPWLRMLSEKEGG
jgi:uncharacterized Zn finger protein (UPF0148 family)